MLSRIEGAIIACWLEPPTKGQPSKRGQELCSQSVLYSEVPLYSLIFFGVLFEQNGCGEIVRKKLVSDDLDVGIMGNQKLH